MAVMKWDGPVLNVVKPGETGFTVSSWWWDTDLLIGRSRKKAEEIGVTKESALAMLVANGVNELYFDVHFDRLSDWGVQEEGKLSKQELAEFIGLCRANGIRVASLTGEGGVYACPWLDPERGYPEFMAHINGTIDFNRHVPENQRFYGVHLDMEPHCGDERPKFLKWMYWMLKALRKACDEGGLELEFDLNSWYNANDMTTDDDGNAINIMDAYADYCDGIAIMSYRPNAEVQKEMSKLMFGKLKEHGCRVLLASETMTPDELGEEALISYYTKGTQYFIKEQQKLRRLIEADGCQKGGIAIHWVNAWFRMYKNMP